MGRSSENTINIVPHSQTRASSGGPDQQPDTGTLPDHAARKCHTRVSSQDFGPAPPGRLAPLGLADYPTEFDDHVADWSGMKTVGVATGLL